MATRRGNEGSGAQSPVRTGSGNVPFLSFLHKIPLTTLLLWAAAVSMGLFFLPLNFLAATASHDANDIQANIVQVRGALTNVPTPIPEIRKLLTPLAVVQGQIAQVDAVASTPVGPQAGWPTVMQTIGEYNPDEITLVSLIQANNRITLTGQANSESAVVAYTTVLEQSDLFSLVTVQSLQLLATQQLTNTLIASKGGTPGATGTLTATPDLRDQYEPDEAQPKSIYVGQPQQHNFFPSGDVDTMTFTAKAFGNYRVLTENLAPGVDTVLTLRVGRSTYTNNEAKAGSTGSEIDFQNFGPDSQALITVTNRGEFGPDKTYTILIEETAPPPTITSIPAPTFTSQPSPAPTATLTPVTIYVTTTPLPSSFNQLSSPDSPAGIIMSGEEVTVNDTVDDALLLRAAFHSHGPSEELAAASMAVRFVLILELKAAP